MMSDRLETPILFNLKCFSSVYDLPTAGVFKKLKIYIAN